MIEFRNNERALTLGAEVELQVLDGSTLRLTPRAAEVIEALGDSGVTKEMFQSTLEVISPVSNNAVELISSLDSALHRVTEFGNNHGMKFSTTGTHPSADYYDRLLSSSSRYQDLLDRNQWLIRRMAVYGLHVHIGMRNGDEAILFQNFFLRMSPILIALSASSPFWNKRYTGLASSRPTTYESHPTSGIPYLANTWEDFRKVYADMIQTGSIESMKDIWWDIRPSPQYGTIELRMCDGVATRAELQAICALVHVLAHWFDQNKEDSAKALGAPPERWILRENKWRAIRFGTQAVLIDEASRNVMNMNQWLSDWREKCEGLIRELHYTSEFELLDEMIARGNSSERQTGLLKISPGGMLSEEDELRLMQFNVEEFTSGVPNWGYL